MPDYRLTDAQRKLLEEGSEALVWRDGTRLAPVVPAVSVDYGSTERHRFQVYEVTAGAVREVSVVLDEPPNGRLWELVKARVADLSPSPQPRPKFTPPPQKERFKRRGRG